MKANVANYIYADLVKKFPSQKDQIVDTEVIDFLIGSWANGEYFSFDSKPKLHHNQRIKPPHLI